MVANPCAHHPVVLLLLHHPAAITLLLHALRCAELC
jgi:hypothetical protein